MTSNYRYYDTELGQYVDLDDYFITDAQIIDRYVGNGLWAWGYGAGGTLGYGDIGNKSIPVQVGNLLNWQEVSSGGITSAAIKTDGTLWVWGQGNWALGLGNTSFTHRSSPAQVGTLTNWKQVLIGGGGNNWTIATKIDGSLWTWGYGGGGTLGLGDQTNRSSPVQVGALTDWKRVGAGTYFIATAIKTDGTLWTWGLNQVGGLGLGDTTNRFSPVQVGTLTNWKYISAGSFYTVSIKTDGTLWAWGDNSNGGLGLGDRNDRSSPVQVGALTNWKQINAGYASTAAIKTDGTFWTWGNNEFGQLGQNDLVHRSSPVQVGSLTNWKQITIDNTNGAAIKTDGTLWAWGHNQYGQLGQNDLVHRSSPIQVGSLTNWKQTDLGSQFITAISYTEI